VVTQLDRPPELILEAWAIETRQRARSNANFAEVLDKFEGRFGDIKEALKNLDFVSADSAYLLHPQKDGTYLPVIHNVRPGQLATALERGFLPLALKDYESAIEASEERKNLGKRGKQAGSRKTQPKKANNKQTSLEIGGS
jgi:hypothetical protein